MFDSYFIAGVKLLYTVIPIVKKENLRHRDFEAIFQEFLLLCHQQNNKADRFYEKYLSLIRKNSKKSHNIQEKLQGYIITPSVEYITPLPYEITSITDILPENSEIKLWHLYSKFNIGYNNKNLEGIIRKSKAVLFIIKYMLSNEKTNNQESIKKTVKIIEKHKLPEEIEYGLNIDITIEELNIFLCCTDIIKNYKEKLEDRYLLSLATFFMSVGFHSISKEILDIVSNKNSKQYLYNKAYLFMADNNITEAEKTLKSILDIDKNHYKALRDIATVMFIQKKFQNAIKYYKKALSIAKKDIDIKHNIGLAYAKLGDITKAIEIFRDVIENNPDFAPAYYNLGVAYADMEQLDKAIFCFEKALEVMPDLSGAWNNMGIVLAKKGRYQEAIISLEKALKYNPFMAEAWHLMGLLYETKLNNIPAAIFCYSRALALQPENRKYRNLLKSLLK